MKLYGKNPVIERIKANSKSIEKIYFNLNNNVEDICELARSKHIRCEFLKEREFLKLAGKHQTQGVIAEIEEFAYASLEDFLDLPDNEKYTLIALSSITDPQNLGSILRTTACFGKNALIIPRHKAVSVNETVLKVACGGENYVPVIQVTNLVPALEKAKKAGYWVAGAVVDGGEDLAKFEFTPPVCLVIGSEGEGIRKGVVEKLDFKLSLPMPGANLSLNAGVACAIFCYEIVRQRK
ncbi:MAG: 23S rRNA (guanosine(2251)-2'-O)-methyltransferase RlmB [PVC group bacterium]|nr:23S rRNA (guanosine(2251)-2'-O)-methyltransferase RlmB [PVC group bacterium]